MAASSRSRVGGIEILTTGKSREDCVKTNGLGSGKLEVEYGWGESVFGDECRYVIIGGGGGGGGDEAGLHNSNDRC